MQQAGAWSGRADQKILATMTVAIAFFIAESLSKHGGYVMRVIASNPIVYDPRWAKKIPEKLDESVNLSTPTQRSCVPDGEDRVVVLVEAKIVDVRA